MNKFEKLFPTIVREYKEYPIELFYEIRFDKYTRKPYDFYFKIGTEHCVIELDEAKHFSGENKDHIFTEQCPCHIMRLYYKEDYVSKTREFINRVMMTDTGTKIIMFTNNAYKSLMSKMDISDNIVYTESEDFTAKARNIKNKIVHFRSGNIDKIN